MLTDTERVRRLRFLAAKVMTDIELNKLCGSDIIHSMNALFLDVANRLEELSHDSSTIRSNGSTEAQDSIL